MIEQLSKHIVSYLINSGVIEDTSNDKEYYQYGIEIAISSMLNILLIILISLATNSFIEGLFFLPCFIIMRNFTGGYHANSYFMCNFLFCLVFAVELIIYKITCNYISFYNAIIICVVCISTIMIICPVENRNKPIIEKRKKLKIISIVITIFLSILGLLLTSFGIIYGVLIIYTVSLVTILAIIGLIKERRHIHV